MHDVFLSYNGRDRRHADAVAKALRSRALEPFFDREALTPGRPWQAELEEAMGRCRAAAILLGPHGLGSWQREEAELALDRQKRDPGFGVIPVLLPGADAPLGLLALRTWIDLAPGDGAALDMLASAIRGEAPSAALQRAAAEAREAVCPYRGLAAFREEDAPFFIGRERIAEELETRIAGRRLTALVGPSGSGKSSIAQAGLLPRLRRAAGRQPLTAAIMQPRTDPFQELARQLVALREPDLAPEDALPKRRKVADFLADEKQPAAVCDWIEEILRERGGGRFLLVVDQWEEIYTAVEDEAARNRFVDKLLLATDRTPLSVLATLRGDYLGHALSRTDMVDRLQGGTVVVGPMDRANLRRAIEEPARKLGVAFQDGLVERMLAEVEGEPGTLPLLQFLLEGLWQARRRGGPLSHGDYEALGGARGAIANQADAVFADLQPADQALARDLLVSLVRPGEGTLDSRRFVDLSGLPEAARRIVHRLGEKRLLVADERQVEVTHEALIREWRRLREWVQEDREFLRVRDRLEPDAAAWHAEGEGAAEDLLVPSGRRLEEARELLRQRPTLLEGEPLIRRYIEASVARADRDAAAKEAERKAKARAARRVTYALGTFTLVALGGAAWAFKERADAQEAKSRAEQVAEDLRRANIMSVAAGDRFVTRAADRLRQVSGMPAARIEELLRDGEDFFGDLARRTAGATPELARSLARMQISFARTSEDLGDLEAQVARSVQARQQLEPLAATGRATADDLQALAAAHEVEADALFQGSDWRGSLVAAERARDLLERALAAGFDPGQGRVALALNDRVAARALAKDGRAEESIGRATSCLRRLEGQPATSPEMRYAQALCQWSLGFALTEAQSKASEGRAAYEGGLKLVNGLIEEDRSDRRYRRLLYVFSNNIGSTFHNADPQRAAQHYSRAVDAARAAAALDPGNLPARDDLALALHNLGTVLQASNARTEAAAAFEEAYHLRRQLVAAQPARGGWASGMESSLERLVRMLRDMGNDPRRLPMERRYLELQLELAARPRAESWRAAERLEALYWTAEAARLAGDGEAAFALYLQVIDEAEPFRTVQDAPRLFRNNLSYAVQLLRGAANRAPESRRAALLLRAEEVQSRYVALDPRHWMWRDALGMTRLDLAKMHLTRGEKESALKRALQAAGESSLREPAELLADWFGTGSGPVASDVERAAVWQAEVRKRSGSMKRFTVPSQSRGLEGKHPWHVYMRDPYGGSDPVEEEIYRVEQYDGVILPEDVKDSFRKLLRIALENNVSFADLTVYALATAAPAEDKLVRRLEPALVLDRPRDALAVLRDAEGQGLRPGAVLLVTARRERFDAAHAKDWRDATPERVQRGPVNLLFDFGNWLSAQGEDALAAEVFTALMEGGRLNTTGEAAVLRLRGHSLERLGEIMRAETDLLQSLTLQPANARTMAQLGLVWADRGGSSLDRAALLLERAERSEATSADVQAGLGWVQVQRGQIAPGIERLERALQAARPTPRTLAYLGEAHRRGGRPDEARRLWGQALNLRPDRHLRSWVEAQVTRLDGPPR